MKRKEMIHPISYSFPAEKIVPAISLKMEHLAKHKYQFTNEDDYLANYRTAFFGKTTKRAGWDCLRHYEILSQGTIPYFPNLEQCPEKTMTTFPKQLVLDLNEKYFPKTLEEIYKESSSVVYNDLDRLLIYTQENLTTEKSVEYLLEQTGNTKAKEILFLTNMVPPATDYLLSMLTHGFKKSSKGRVDCYPEFEYHYKSFPLELKKKLYGQGFNYTHLLPDEYKTKDSFSEINRKVQNHEYDCIFLFFDEYSDDPVPIDILKTYNDSEITLLCGKDCDARIDETGGWTTSNFHRCNLKQISNKQRLFIRELS